MKIVVHLKDPDGFSTALDEAVEASFKGSDLLKDEQEALTEIRQERLSKAMEKWVEYGEYVTIEFDTEAGTATVMPK